MTGRYFIPSIFDSDENNSFFEGLSLSLDNTDLVLQSTPTFWSMWDDEEGNSGIVRSEIVGFKKNIAAWLFEGQDEKIGLPMERIVKLKSIELMQSDERKVKYFPKLILDEPVRNAEGKLIENL